MRRKCGPRDATIGSAGSASEGAAEKESFQARPKLRPGDIVEAVLGVVATQHSGDGKANQYFLRGFNLDPGTDFAVTVDWMPVNMPTHGHGQGFADLDFLIPDLVSGATARARILRTTATSRWPAAHRWTVSSLDAPFAEVTLGSNSLRRLLAAGSRTVQDQTWLGAVELEGNNGPGTHPNACARPMRCCATHRAPRCVASRSPAWATRAGGTRPIRSSSGWSPAANCRALVR